MGFDFATAGRVIFGIGTVSQLPDLAHALGKKPFVVSGRGGERHRGVVARLVDRGPWLRLDGEPDFEGVRQALNLARSEACDHVVAIGGGSAIDAGKAIAMLITNGGDPMDYAEIIGSGNPVKCVSAPFLAIPATAGAGAEVTRNAVLRSREHGVKVSLRSALMIPSIALVDPELTLELPPFLTASTGLDALAQVLEPFVSCRANELTDPLCREGLLRIGRSLRVAFGKGDRIEARIDMAFGALVGGMALANAGLGAVHGFAAPIGGMFDAPHGAVCAALLAPVMEGNIHHKDCGLETRRRYDEAARILTQSASAKAEDGIAWVRDLTRDLRILGLSKYGIGEAHVEELCHRAAGTSSMRGNPVVLESEALRSILRAAI